MRKNGLVIAALVSLAGGALGACSIEDVPHAPTFNTDIKPIMLSRCVRCHGAGGHLNADPQATDPSFRQPFDGFFDRMEDDCPDAQPINCHGLGHYTSGVPEMTLTTYIHSQNPISVMPPRPAPTLTSHQLDVIDLWLANGAPEN